MAESDYESVLCVKPEIHVYRIPPRATNRGYRAADWKLDQPDWTGRLRITAKGNIAYIKLEDRISGRRAFIGIGFVDRGDAFDFNVGLQDHFKWVKQQSELAKQAQNPDSGPKLDLGFKEGQTIKLSIGNVRKKENSSTKPRLPGTGIGLLPPPPGAKAPFLLPPPGSQDVMQQPTQSSSAEMLTDFDAPESCPVLASHTASTDVWGDFATATSSATNQVAQSTNWVQF
ncbi:adaptin ear-binding coat-associated protein 2-like isoform X1 [Mustelus asterias]